jgi:hypothetical protein
LFHRMHKPTTQI